MGQKNPQYKPKKYEYSKEIGTVIYEPKATKWRTDQLYTPPPRHLYRAIEEVDDPALREMLTYRAAWLCEFNYGRIADYYAYQASAAEQRAFEALGLVLLDRDQLIVNGFSNLMLEAMGAERDDG